MLKFLSSSYQILCLFTCLNFLPGGQAQASEGEKSSLLTLVEEDLVQEKYDQLHRLHGNVVPLTTVLSLLVIGGDPSQNLVITPFATGPDGKIHLGDPSRVPVATATVELNPVIVRHPYKGSCTVGGFIALENPTVSLPTTTIGLSGSIRGQLGQQFQAALIPSTIVDAPLLNPPASFICTYSTNFEMKIPLPFTLGGQND